MDNNIKRLPDAYYKKQNGNNYKLLQLNNLSANELLNEIQKVNSWRDIDNAQGTTLDLFGATYNKKRGNLTDGQYRVIIKNAIAENLCQGDLNSIIALLSQVLGCSQSEIIINEMGNNKIKISVPLVAGFTIEQTIAMINRLLPITVYVEDATFEGTFEFCGMRVFTYNELCDYKYSDLEQYTYSMFSNRSPAEFDENKGFGNIQQTIGGYLGHIKKGE